jgi:gliding motility-associated-like protein|tara:strand:+ start:3349 stop:6384 length:3036 start_codon:yes stop_codon:yes gene_type:complete
MKLKLLFTLTFVILVRAGFGQMTFTNTQNPSQLVQNVLLGTGITVSNITVNGTAANALSITNKIGYFEDGNSTFPISRGVVLGTGNINQLAGVSSTFVTSTVGGGSDPDLVSISGVTINDANVLEFDFVAIGDSMNFRYIFGSEEYPEYVGSTVNDAFGFFLSGPGITGTYTNNAVNLAIIPGTTTAVSINTVNQNINTAYYTSNAANFYGTSSVLDGFTVLLVAASNLQCGGSYHIKIAIGDGGDSAFDSAVFLEAESFSSNVVTIDAQSTINTGSFTDTILAEGCVSTELLFIRPEIYTDSAQTFYVTISGTATAADFTSLPTSVFFAIGVDTVSYTLTPIADGITEPMEWLQVKGYSVTVCGDTIYDSLTVYVVDHYDFSYTVPDSAFAVCVPDTPAVNLTGITGSVGPFSTLWSFGDTTNSVFLPNNGFQPDTITYFVTVTDFCGWQVFDSVVLVVDSLPPAFNITPGYNSVYTCIDNDLLFTAAVTSPTIGPYIFTWSNGTVSDTSTLLDNNVTGDTIVYTVSLLDGCGTTITDTVTIIADYDIPEFDITPTGPLYASCPNSLLIASLNITPGSAPNYGPYQILWSNGVTTATNFTIGNNGVNGDQQWHYAVTTNYCGQQTVDSILVINQFTLPIAAISPNSPLIVDCMPDSALATASITNGTNAPYTYLWNDGSTSSSNYIQGGLINGASTPFSVTITDGCGFSATANGVIQVNKTLAFDTLIATLSAACLPTGTVIGTIVGETTTTTPTYQWVGPSPSFIDTTNNAGATNLSPGMYTLTVWDDVCSITDSVEVFAENPPIASFTANLTDGCAGMSVTFTNTSQDASYFEWDFGNGNLASDNSLTSHTEQYFSSETVTLIAYSDATKTCSSSANIAINVVICGCTDPNAINYDPNAIVQSGLCVYPIPVVEDPNVFTPNGDGENDLYFFKTSYTTTFHLTITNRWGNVMYDKILDLTAPVGPQGWNGTAPNGNEAKAGTYFYQYKAIGINGDEVTGKGFLQLVRD